MTITIELPDTAPVMKQLLSLSAAERSRFVTDLVTRYVPTESSLSDEDIAAIEAGIADAEAGRVRPAADVFADIRQSFGWEKGDNPL